MELFFDKIMLLMNHWAFSFAVGLGAIGSAMGILEASRAACGAWAKESKEGKPINTTYVILAVMPVSQTIYAILAGYVAWKNYCNIPGNGPLLLGAALSIGIAEFISAYSQGLIGAAGIRSLSEGSKGFVQIIILMGTVEFVGLLGLIFAFLMQQLADIVLKVLADAQPVTSALQFISNYIG